MKCTENTVKENCLLSAIGTKWTIKLRYLQQRARAMSRVTLESVFSSCEAILHRQNIFLNSYHSDLSFYALSPHLGSRFCAWINKKSILHHKAK